MQLFVSYSRVDRPFTEKFVTRLRRMYPNDEIWYDEELYGGDYWWDEILAQITACDIFIYLLSNESVTSPYCQAEFTEARRLQKRVITIQVRDRTNPTPELADIQYIDMKNGTDDPDAITNLGRAINYQLRKLPKRPLKPLWPKPTARPVIPKEVPNERREDVITPSLYVEIPAPVAHRTNRRIVWITAIIAVIGILAVVATFASSVLSNNSIPTKGSPQLTTTIEPSATIKLIASNTTLPSTPTKQPLNPTSTNRPSNTPFIPTATHTIDFAAAAQTFDALSTAAVKATSLAQTRQSILDRTATATRWTQTPTPTLSLTPNITASFEAFLTYRAITQTQQAVQNQTATAKSWTKTPTSTPSETPTMTPSDTATYTITPTSTFTKTDTPEPTSTPTLVMYTGVVAAKSCPYYNAPTRIGRVGDITMGVIGYNEVITVFGVLENKEGSWYHMMRANEPALTGWMETRCVIALSGTPPTEVATPTSPPG